MLSRAPIGLQSLFKAAAMIAALALFAAPGSAATYDESIRGDLPNNAAAPQPLPFTLSANPILGAIGSGAGADSLDAIALTVPPGMVLSGFVNVSYSGATAQDFIGFQPGASFVGSVFTNSNYAGLAHFGLTAVNTGVGTPPGSPTSTVGVDLLPLMNSTGVAIGATGFTIPLGPGTYTFVLGPQGLSESEFPTYQFNAIVTVPEPAALLTLGIAVFPLLFSRRRVAHR